MSACSKPGQRRSTAALLLPLSRPLSANHCKAVYWNGGDTIAKYKTCASNRLSPWVPGEESTEPEDLDRGLRARLEDHQQHADGHRHAEQPQPFGQASCQRDLRRENTLITRRTSNGGAKELLACELRSQTIALARLSY